MGTSSQQANECEDQWESGGQHRLRPEVELIRTLLQNRTRQLNVPRIEHLVGDPQVEGECERSEYQDETMDDQIDWREVRR
jgi:hypothetical protein